MFKKGDNVVFLGFPSGVSCQEFTIGKTYRVIDNDAFSYLWLTNDNGKIAGYNKFYYVFVSLKEYRKDKLKKLESYEM